MEQVIISGQYSLLHSTDTEYNCLFGGSAWTPNVDEDRSVVSLSGKIKNLRVKLDGSPGAGTHYDFTLMLNDAPTALTLEIADAATSGSNATEIDVVAGDTISLECNPDGAPTARRATWTCVFEGTTEKESLISGLSRALFDQIHYSGIFGGKHEALTDENNVRQVCPTSGTIKDLYIKLNNDPGTAPDAYRFTVRLNGATVAESLIVTIVANDTTGYDTTHNLVVTAGDVLTMMFEPIDTPSVSPLAAWGMTFVADTDGESIIMGGTESDLDASATEYNAISRRGVISWTSLEYGCYQLGQVCILKKLYVLLSGTPGSGKKYDFTIRIAVASSNVVATVSGTDTTGNSGALEDTVVNDDYVNLECNPDGAPTVRDAYWGLVSYIEPPVVGWAGGDVLGVDIGTIAKINGVALADITKVNGVA